MDIRGVRRGDEYLSYYEESIKGESLITSEEQFKDISSPYRVLFQTLELAEKYCEMKNKEETKVKNGAQYHA
jgi:hypothetical protein